MESIITESLTDLGLKYGVSLPMAVVIVITVLCLVAWGALYFFNSQTRKLFNKHGIRYELVEPVVNMLTMLAVRLFVMKSSVEDTRKVTQLKIIAKTIDGMYSTGTTLRLSELVMVVEQQLVKNTPMMTSSTGVLQLADLDAKNQVDLLHGLSNSITNEISQVARKVQDNEEDPLVEPRELSRWINKSLSTVVRVKNAQKKV